VNTALQGRQVAFSDLALSSLFIPHFQHGSEAITPIVAVGWTLNFEMFFYAVFASTLLLPRNVRLYALAAVFLFLFAAGPFSHPAAAIYYFSALPLEFLIGCAIGALFERAALLPKTASALLAASAVAALVMAPVIAWSDFSIYRVVWWGIPGAALVLASLSFQAEMSKLGRMTLIGEASYSLYLTHSIPLVALKVAAIRAGLPATAPFVFAFVILGCAVSVVAAVMVWRVIEAPATNLLRSRFSNRRFAETR
jgi:exopolysaccharide production protein ExoZ